MWDILNLPIGRRGSLIDKIIWLANSIVFAIQPLLTSRRVDVVSYCSPGATRGSKDS